NYKQRIEQEKAIFGPMANRAMIQEVLEIHDDLQLAINDADLDIDRAKESITSAQAKLKNVVKASGVETVEIAVGDEFNKETMEAIQAIPDENNKNTVIAIISSAYKYTSKDGILKPAKVIVGK